METQPTKRCQRTKEACEGILDPGVLSAVLACVDDELLLTLRIASRRMNDAAIAEALRRVPIERRCKLPSRFNIMGPNEVTLQFRKGWRFSRRQEFAAWAADFMGDQLDEDEWNTALPKRETLIRKLEENGKASFELDGKIPDFLYADSHFHQINFDGAKEIFFQFTSSQSDCGGLGGYLSRELDFRRLVRMCFLSCDRSSITVWKVDRVRTQVIRSGNGILAAFWRGIAFVVNGKRFELTIEPSGGITKG